MAPVPVLLNSEEDCGGLKEFTGGESTLSKLLLYGFVAVTYAVGSVSGPTIGPAVFQKRPSLQLFFCFNLLLLFFLGLGQLFIYAAAAADAGKLARRQHLRPGHVVALGRATLSLIFATTVFLAFDFCTFEAMTSLKSQITATEIGFAFQKFLQK